MRILSLDRLAGHGRSNSENFELLCLELVRVSGGSSSKAHRNTPPDGGIDIYDPEERLAYQCKAYPSFREDLVRAIRDSACAAKRAQSQLPFDAYVLVIPFVPTKEQRIKIMEALADSGAKAYIVDADEIETRLYNSPGIATRFFPSVVVVVPPQCSEIMLKTGDSPTIQLRLTSTRTEQQIPMRVSTDASVIGFKRFIIALLRLPNTYSIEAASFINSGEIQWALSVSRDGVDILLPDDKTLANAKVHDGDILHLTFENRTTFQGGFMKRIGPHWENAKIDSAIWDADEMNRALIFKETKGGSVDLRELVEAYVSWHIGRVVSSQVSS